MFHLALISLQSLSCAAVRHMRDCCPELRYLFHVSLGTNIITEICNFVKSLMNSLLCFHSKDEPQLPVRPVRGSYYPQSGVAYYFSESGNIGRPLRRYLSSSDDVTESGCSKNYPKVSSGRFAHSFLWFCPIHGHCYGFHLTDGAEGRKDPFASLVKYLEVQREEIFYDFLCSLSEYSLNREPDLFKHSRFWHDLCMISLTA